MDVEEDVLMAEEIPTTQEQLPHFNNMAEGANL